MSRNFLKEIVLELRYERQNGCGCWEGVLGREQCVQGPKVVPKPGCKWWWGGGDGRRPLLKVQARIAGRLE